MVRLARGRPFRADVDLKTFEKVVVYASEWKNLVEIVDIYEQRYYVSCTQADELVALLQSE